MHFDVVSKFSAITSSPGSPSEDEMMAILAMVLKCADLGHSCLPWNEHVRWFRLLEEVTCSEADLTVLICKSLAQYGLAW